MLRTPLCDVLHIEFPIFQAGMGPWTSAELVAAVSNAGGLGILGGALRSVDNLRTEVARLHELTNKPFAINFTLMNPIDEDFFAAALEAKPPIISLALGDPGELVKRAHDVGILVIHQVASPRRAREAAERGVDVLIAQGSEAGGYGGTVSTLALVPQVVDVVNPRPVVAAGGITDGRGLVAALALGAQGVSLGTRFLASVEAPISDGWKQAILAAESEDTVKFEVWNDIFPPESGTYGTTPRVLHSPFVDEWINRSNDVRGEAERLREQVMAAIQKGGFQELLPFTGQSAGSIREVLPAAQIVTRIVAQAEEAIAGLTRVRA